MQYYVYILTNKPHGVIYIGVTNNLARRMYEHKNNLLDGFSSKYHTYQLVYFEYGNSIEWTITREKQLKKWNREWKVRLIEEENPEWRDLADEIRE